MKRLARILFIPFVVLLGTPLNGGCNRTPDVVTLEQSLSVCAAGPTLDGIDVSHWQGAIDWDSVAGDGITFAFIRVSDGTGTYDSRFQYNWSEAKRVGIIRGVYQFFRPSQDPVAQADLLISEIGGAMEAGDLPPVIDVETDSGLSKATVAAKVQQWIDRIESVLGVTPIVYTSPGVWSSYVNSSAFGAYPLWVAHYDVSCPTLPTGWSSWLFHQYTDSGAVAGISSSGVDRNVFNGTLTDLQALTWDAAPPVCGDGVCTAGEDATCPQDCPTCETIPAIGRILDEDDLCLELGGDPQYWRSESAGYNGSLRWTYTVASQVFNYAEWDLTFEQGGWYRVEAYTAAPWAESQQAKYRITHRGATDVVEVDQTAIDGWTAVGVFEFTAGGNQAIRLEDLTGETGDTRLVVDALRLIPVAAPAGCEAVPPQGRVVEEDDACVDLEGDAQYWRQESAGSGGSLLWTHTVASQAYNAAVWNLRFEQAGYYRVEAYTAAPWAESRQAKYRVTHDGITDVISVDQTQDNGWTEVGVFEFAAGADQRVRLEDLTGESGATDTQLVVDALRVVPVADPTGCGVIPPTGRTLEEDDACVDLEGDAQYWRHESAGSDGALVWTHTVASQVYNYALWNLHFEETGRYLVEVFTPAPYGESRQAKYQVHHGTDTEVASVDQSAVDGWTRVGEFDFEAGGNQWMRLEDLTGEPGSTDTRLVVDAIRITRIGQGTGGAPPTDSYGDDPMQGGREPYGNLGCNAAATGGAGTAPVWLVLLPLVLVWLRRRRF